MKLIYRILIRLSLALLPIIALWGALFYFALENEINDEADDALERYSDYIMMRVLAGEQTPQHNDGTNNTYNLRPITIEFAFSVPHIEYYDSVINIVGTDEMEPARVLKTIFFDRKGQYYELTVSMPTFEKEDLIATILNWIIILYILLLLIVISMSGWVIYKSLKPLYALLDWLHNYIPGKKRHNIVDIKTDITEFNKLNQAVEIATNRSEELYEKQKQFIGNASHELQTPLSVINNRLDILLDD